MKTSLYLARLLGLYVVIMAVVWAIGGGALMEHAEALMSEPAVLYLGGILALVAGLAIVVGHNVWEPNWRVAITLIGYLSLLKGIVLLLWPEAMVQLTEPLLQNKGFLTIYMAVFALLGAWLAWIGFTGGKPKNPAPARGA